MPFSELLPLSALDTDLHQQYRLPLFAFLTFLHVRRSDLCWSMWRDKPSRRWLLLIALLVVPRLVLLGRMENPEPRYVVEFFAFVAVTGALAVTAAFDRLRATLRSRPLSKERTA